MIIVSGFAGSGKSTLTEELAEHFKLEFIHASDLLHKLRKGDVSEFDVEHTHAGSGYWESPEGHKFLHEREKDDSMDRKLDELLLKIADKGNVVLDSWTMPWLCKKGFKIWLNTDSKVRANRVAERDKLDELEVYEKIIERDKITATIYEKLYGFEMKADESIFDFIIDNSKMEKIEVFNLAKEKINEKFGKK